MSGEIGKVSSMSRVKSLFFFFHRISLIPTSPGEPVSTLCLSVRVTGSVGGSTDITIGGRGHDDS